jgi:hypothetical protein
MLSPPWATREGAWTPYEHTPLLPRPDTLEPAAVMGGSAMQ